MASVLHYHGNESLVKSHSSCLIGGSSVITSSYWYAWSELGFRPAEWLRIGLAGECTRAYGGERDIQRGPFAQLTWRKITIGSYWFNPGSRDQVVVGLVGVTF
ncbi:MAG: hypothetical protein ABI580_14060 [Burkholderiaceae bacterium]